MGRRARPSRHRSPPKLSCALCVCLVSNVSLYFFVRAAQRRRRLPSRLPSFRLGGRAEHHYSGVSRRGLFSKAIRLIHVYYINVYTYIYIYIYGFLVCRYASSLVLAARQNTPAIDGAIYLPNGTSYQLQPSFHPHSTEPEPTARARRGRRVLLDNSRVYVRFLPFVSGRNHLDRISAH